VVPDRFLQLGILELLYIAQDGGTQATSTPSQAPDLCPEMLPF
jgi:hypothetical protein